MPRFDNYKIQNHFNKAATRYDDHAQLQQDVFADCLTLAREFWSDNAQILDIGCGTGALSQALGNNVLNLDMSFSMCKIAHKYGGAINANSESLPFKNDSFDGVFSSLMLQWVNEPKLVFKEIFRVLKPGGRCIISTFIHGTLEELSESFKSLDDHIHINQFGPPNYFSALAVHNGFRLLSSDENIITEYYPSVTHLMRALKAVGASAKEQDKISRGLMTPRKLEKLEHSYHKRYAHKEGLPASWHVMVMLLEKP